MTWKLEDDVNHYINNYFAKLHLEKWKDYNTESAMSEYLKEALKGSAKTHNKTNFWKPDFHIEWYTIPVIIENKLWIKKLISENKDWIKNDEKSIRDFAVNGALHYTTSIIASGKYSEAIAIGIAGDSEENIKIQTYYVYGTQFWQVKLMQQYEKLDFLENKKSFENFYNDCILSEKEKHTILIKNKADLATKAWKLNKLMHNHSITATQRVLYVSGMLLSMQDTEAQPWLTPDDLEWIQTETRRDSIKIFNAIAEFLKVKNIPEEKVKLMLASFSEISKDKQRDELTELDKEVSKLLDKEASITKQIFTFIYENIHLSIESMQGHLDIMGELYSEFLKYALGDGKELGIVLTPPYVTKMMCEILNINQDSRVMDLATGSAGFLISAMQMMIDDTNTRYGKDTEQALEKIKTIKSHQLLWVELNAEMFTLAATNMILRGDGSSNIQKGNTFKTPKELYTDFKPNRILLNPPFSFEENGMPFIKFGLEHMEKWGLGAIIIQDSAGSGKAATSNTEILKKHTLLASIKMPTDLFQPMAGVQTSIYVLQAHTPHDFDKTVKFIDFRNDGYKRTKRDLYEEDHPTERYEDIVKIYKAWLQAKVHEHLWDNLEDIYIEDFITSSWDDWNYDQHKIIDTKPTLQDFKKTVADYLAREVSNLLKNQTNTDDRLGKSKPHSTKN